MADQVDLTTKLRLISYQQHIRQWLTACLTLPMRPAVHAVLAQYAHIVKRLTHRGMTDEARDEMNAIVKLTASADNALNAFKMVDNWKHVRWHTESHFWHELLALVGQSGFAISEEKKFSDEKLDLWLHEGKGDPWYGIVIPLNEYNVGAVSVTLIIERGDREIKYGVRLTSPDQVAGQQVFAEFAQRLAGMERLSTQPGWPARRYTSRQINFQAFRHPDTIKLADPQVRQTTVAALWDEVQRFLREVRERLDRSTLPTHT